MKKLWGGRFAGAQDPRFAAFNASLRFDRKLWREDIQGSLAWAHALEGAGVLTHDERSAIVAALIRIEDEIARDESALTRSNAEDVHAYVETRLGEISGDLAKKLHTGRSRNDQVATDLKLWMKVAVLDLVHHVRDLITALVELASAHATAAMPGYTHLQRAQPITVGHHALAYVEMLARDRSRLLDALARFDTCPLGSGALAGTAYGIDREALSRELEFAHPTRNSLDAVSDRDHVCEVAFACSLVGVHLSRFAEDWIFFASQEAAFLELSDSVATGSSLMPQKKNPDSLELLRGKSGRLFGHLMALLTMLKGAPLAYDKDLQEDKEALFDCIDTTRESLAVAAIVVRNARFDVERCRREASRGCLNATDLADILVAAGVPFRTAHERTGSAVRAAIERGCELEDLPPAQRAELLPELASMTDATLRAALSVDAVLARRSALGGTSPTRVQAEVQAWKKRLETWNS